MPALEKHQPGVSAILNAVALFDELLDEASAAKTTSAIEPPLGSSALKNLFGRVSETLSNGTASENEDNEGALDMAKARRFAVIETAARELFQRLIASISIDAPDFIRMWNLLDILSLLSDNGQCDPALLFWLVEELLDSQTIAGCTLIFDYLESRRERITAKHFKQKNLVILRSCNELLRRLSRAEDTAFCGRVFIFMFQSFPLGDRSSVNLRGEYHVENVTSYEHPSCAEATMTMAVDTQPTSQDSKTSASGSGLTSLDANSQDALDLEKLYPLFWSMQESFSQPMKLFDSAHFSHFKGSLEATIKVFQATHNSEGIHSSKPMENMRRDLRRKKEEGGATDGLETFNPKYLTSKDLFGLEISDLSFRRHVLVQALIIIDFILSQSEETKDKLTSVNASNKSVIYNEKSNEDSTQWANEMKTTISDYLKRGHDGPYFYRTVETVLARDKNWVFWKIAGCPPIQRDSVLPESYKEAIDSAQRMATSRRLRPTPVGAVNMDFLRADPEKRLMVDALQKERFKVPNLMSFQQKIADADLAVKTASTPEAKAAAKRRKSAQTWRALRLARTGKMRALDKIEDLDSIHCVFDDLSDDEDSESQFVADESEMPQNREPVIITGLEGSDTSGLVESLMQRNKGVFATVIRHTSRQPCEGEIRGKSFHFVAVQEFRQLRDGDRFIEYHTTNGIDYGTSISAVDSVVESGKVPLILMNLDSVRLARDLNFAARYFCIDPRGPTSFPQDQTDQVKAHQDVATDLSVLFDNIITGPDTHQATETLSAYIFAKDEVQEPFSSIHDEEIADDGGGSGLGARSDYNAAEAGNA